MDEPHVSSLRLDSRALQVLAHPLRSRLLTALRMDGPATATALAATLGTNTGATSYHLRKLASVGLVEETGEGRGTERPWPPATGSDATTCAASSIATRRGWTVRPTGRSTGRTRLVRATGRST